jgi:GntR family transcriptional regulator/MocR family aminotransferase
VPDLSGFPRAAWLRAERAVLGEASAADLGYGDPRGSERLRKELGGWLARTRGIRADPDDIIIVAGVAQALALLAQVLRARAETGVAVEDPGSFGTRNELAHWGLNPVPIPVDDQGMVVASLVRSGLRTALLTPAHQFPSGVVLAPRRRHDLLDWAAGGGLVIEDDYDAEYRYDRAPVPALQASAPDQIAYTGSTSKTLAPGMRLGWLIPPRRLHADLVTAKHASDLGSPSLPQLILARLIATGELERHTRLARKRQRTRRDALLTALREHLPSVRVQGVAAGLHLVITFPSMAGEVDDAALASRLRTAGVLVHPLSMHRQRPGPPGLVLGYAAHPPGQLRDAALRIARAVHASAPSLPPTSARIVQVPGRSPLRAMIPARNVDTRVRGVRQSRSVIDFDAFLTNGFVRVRGIPQTGSARAMRSSSTQQRLAAAPSRRSRDSGGRAPTFSVESRHRQPSPPPTTNSSAPVDPAGPNRWHACGPVPLERRPQRRGLAHRGKLVERHRVLHEHLLDRPRTGHRPAWGISPSVTAASWAWPTGAAIDSARTNAGDCRRAVRSVRAECGQNWPAGPRAAC